MGVSSERGDGNDCCTVMLLRTILSSHGLTSPKIRFHGPRSQTKCFNANFLFFCFDLVFFGASFLMFAPFGQNCDAF